MDLIGPEGLEKRDRLAGKIPHIILFRTLDKVAGKTARFLRDVEEIRKMKRQPGRTAPGPSLMNLGLIGELELTVNPLILGRRGARFLSQMSRWLRFRAAISHPVGESLRKSTSRKCSAMKSRKTRTLAERSRACGYTAFNGSGGGSNFSKIILSFLDGT